MLVLPTASLHCSDYNTVPRAHLHCYVITLDVNTLIGFALLQSRPVLLNFVNGKPEALRGPTSELPKWAKMVHNRNMDGPAASKNGFLTLLSDLRASPEQRAVVRARTAPRKSEKGIFSGLFGRWVCRAAIRGKYMHCLAYYTCNGRRKMASWPRVFSCRRRSVDGALQHLEKLSVEPSAASWLKDPEKLVRVRLTVVQDSLHMGPPSATNLTLVSDHLGDAQPASPQTRAGWIQRVGLHGRRAGQLETTERLGCSQVYSGGLVPCPCSV